MGYEVDMTGEARENQSALKSLPLEERNRPTRRRRGRSTYSIQPTSRQDALRSRRNAAPIPLQIPHDIPAIQLRKHLRDLLDLRRVDNETTPGLSDCCIGAIRVVAIQEPSNHEE